MAKKKAGKAKAPFKEVTTGQEQPRKKGLLEEIEEMRASGNTQSDEFKQKVRELEVILGVEEISPFGTNELDIFEDRLKEMNGTDMMRVAQKAGLNPHLPRPQLKANLLKEFKAYTRNSRRNLFPHQGKAMELDPNNPQHAKVIKILQDF
tara:strand:+ start:7981 stop:8430 length:450 start_codon:yes stop_codon:yes gene_type:complete